MNQSIGDVVRRDEKKVGEFDVAEPAIVQPGQFVDVDGAVGKVDRKKVGERAASMLTRRCSSITSPWTILKMVRIPLRDRTARRIRCRRR